MEDDLHWKMTYKYLSEFPISEDLTGFGIIFVSEVKKIWSRDILLFPCLHRYVVNKPSRDGPKDLLPHSAYLES
jgi:hypothetical protein